jgi:formamidopyrimidine-DNA glycosylase
MPELPEVETIKNEIAPHVIDRVITGVTVSDPKIIQKISIAQFTSAVIGQRIVSLERRGKYLIMLLHGGKTLIFHMRMTGNLMVNPAAADRYSRAVIKLNNGSSIVFTDRRRLGVIWLVDKKEDVIAKVGIEPFDEKFNDILFRKLLKNYSAPVKAVLLDQHFIAGLGNMYADEALFVAGIHPQRKAGTLTVEETKKLFEAIRSVLSKAIENKGATVDTYRRPDGVHGTAQKEFNVAHRLGKACPVCGTPIERIPIRNRGSYFCPKCQRK